jgi:hypothetical protein
VPAEEFGSPIGADRLRSPVKRTHPLRHSGDAPEMAYVMSDSRDGLRPDGADQFSEGARHLRVDLGSRAGHKNTQDSGDDVGDSASFPVPGRVRSWPKSTNYGRALELYPLLLAGWISARPAQTIKICTPCAAARSHTPGTRRLPLLAEEWMDPRLR